MIHQIQNDNLTVAIATKGAELQSIYSRHTELEYMWGAGPEWTKKSPVLFPIVGGLKNNQYTYNGNTYSLNRHGFAREMEFAVTEKNSNTITFTLTDNETTLKSYPFHFEFSVKYVLHGDKINISYVVKNTDDKTLLFSAGGHPAFKLPLAKDIAFDDYYLQFSDTEAIGRWPLTKDGLIEMQADPLIDNSNILPLTKSLFYQDALVFKNLQSTSVAIASHKTPHGLKVTFEGFPYLGIWNAKDADFVCIEPWCGIADSVNTTGNLAEKEGINFLAPMEVFLRTWSIELF